MKDLKAWYVMNVEGVGDVMVEIEDADRFWNDPSPWIPVLRLARIVVEKNRLNHIATAVVPVVTHGFPVAEKETLVVNRDRIVWRGTPVQAFIEDAEAAYRKVQVAREADLNRIIGANGDRQP